MAERFERSIQDWYQNSRTANLEFLNLANPNLSDLSNNITILYDKLLLHSKISIKHFYQLQEHLSQQTEALEKRLQKIELTQSEILRSIRTLEEEILHGRLISQQKAISLINETTLQAGEAEQRTLQISTRIEEKQKQVLNLVSDLKKHLIGE